jgi:type III secretion protein T
MFELLTADEIKDLLWPLVAAYPRIFGFWLAFPLLGEKAFPAMIRNGISLTIALFCWPINRVSLPDDIPDFSAWFWLAPKEIFIGFSIGFTLGVAVWALESAGTMIDNLSGTNNAAQMDPSIGAPVGPTAQLGRHFALLVLLTSGYLGYFVILLAESFSAWPWFSTWPNSNLFGESFFRQRTTFFWDLTLRFVAPVMLAMLLLEIGLGLINRATAQFDVYRIGMPIKSLVAAVAIAVSATFWSESLIYLFSSDVALLRESFRK